MKNNPFNPTALGFSGTQFSFFVAWRKQSGEVMRMSNKAVLWTNQLKHRILSVYKINFKLKETKKIVVYTNNKRDNNNKP